MTPQTLPPECYAALAALKAQAQALSALGQAQQAMATNEPWTSAVARALMANQDGITIDTADDAWLERTFSEDDTASTVGSMLAPTVRSLKQLDATRPLELLARNNDGFMSDFVPGLRDPIQLTGTEAHAFLAWAGSANWRYQFECYLQCLSEDEAGNPFLTTWMPLATFREQFCRQGLAQQDPTIQALMQRLLDATAGWAAAGANEVDLDGYFTQQEQAR